jgi:hypothetical protein
MCLNLFAEDIQGTFGTLGPAFETSNKRNGNFGPDYIIAAQLHVMAQ